MTRSDLDDNDLFWAEESAPAEDQGVLTHNEIFGDILASLGGRATGASVTGGSSRSTGGPVRVRLPEPRAAGERGSAATATERLDELVAGLRSGEPRPAEERPKRLSIDEIVGQAPARPTTDPRRFRAEPPDAVLQLLEPTGAEGQQDVGYGLDLSDLVDEDSAASGSAPRASLGSLGPYELLERTAIGGMAEVYKARRGGPGGFSKIFAVKRILPHLATNPAFVDLFVNEAKTVSRLDHPNIVGIQELGRAEGSYYIVMEFVHGRDLRAIRDRLSERGRKIPLDLAVFVGRRVCAALDYAHRARDESGAALQIVHSDISPQNILISFDGEVKLLDFGIARAARRAGAMDETLLRGKLFYMSPEQATGQEVGHRSDIFSLGVVLYELTTGTKPFATTAKSAAGASLQASPVPPRKLNPGMPERLEAAILKCLERAPRDRFEDAVALSRALERSIDGGGISALEMARFMELLFDDRPDAEVGAGGESVRVPRASMERTPTLEIEVEEAPARTGWSMPSLEAASKPTEAPLKRVWRRIFG